MLVYSATRKHSRLVRFTFISGYFLLFASLGTFGSAAVIAHQLNVMQSQWTPSTATIRSCKLGEYGHYYGLACRIRYQFNGRAYQEAFPDRLTRSRASRDRIMDWVGRHRPGDELAINVNPADPRHVFVKGDVPVAQGDTPEGFIYAAIILAAAGLTLTAIARKFVRAGW